MSNEIFYTFSTIPQVIAAVIALVGVFAIFQIQHLNRVLDGLAQNFFDILNEEERKYNNGDGQSFIAGDLISELRRFKLTYKYKQITETMSQVLKILENPRPDFHRIGTEIRIEYSSIITKKENLIRRAVTSTGFSCILILFAILILPFANRLEGLLAWIIIFLFFSFTCICIYKIFLIIKKALKE